MVTPTGHRNDRREKRRQEALDRYEILDTPSEESYWRLARLAAYICQTPVGLVNIIDRTRQWAKGSFGPGDFDVARELSLCTWAVEEDALLVVEDARSDPRFTGNPLVLRSPKIRFYAGVPVHSREGLPLGTLCVIDHVPRRLEADRIDVLKLLAKEVETHLELRRLYLELKEAESAKNTIVAMIAHDLGNPLTTLQAGLSLLPEQGSALLAEDQTLVYGMVAATEILARLVDDARDVIRGARLVPRYEEIDVSSLFRMLAAGEEHRAHLSGHGIRFEVDVDKRPFRTDPSWLRRIVSNFLDNAFKYAPRDSEITVTVRWREGEPFRVVVADRGPGVPPALRDRIFDAFFRSSDDAARARPGTGLGLAFSRMAAEAMGGRVGVDDHPDGPGARFWLELPNGL